VRTDRRIPVIALIVDMIVGVSALCAPQAVPAVISLPARMTVQDGSFRITPETYVISSEDSKAEAPKLIAFLAPAMGFRLNLTDLARLAETWPAAGAEPADLDEGGKVDMADLAIFSNKRIRDCPGDGPLG